jgi:capsular polysaccharide transport system permease protein
LLKLINTQIRVIHALALREIQLQQAKLAYGFGWVFFDAFLGFASLMIMKFAIRGFNRPGVPPVTFLVSGLIPWMMFSTTYHAPGSAIQRGKRLLELPMVTELDLVLASALRIFLVYTILFILLGVIGAIADGIAPPRFPLGIALLFFFMSLMGIAFGFVLMALSRLYSPAGKFIGFFLRFAMIFSGVVFQLTMFPPTVWPYLLWNPLLHAEELLRIYWFANYQTPGISPLYVAECLLGMVFFGLLLERYMRRRLPS